MKILYHHRVASKDGQYVHVEEIVNALRNMGHEIILVEPGTTESKDFGKSSGLVKSIRTHLPGFMHELIEFGYSFYDYFRLKSAIKRHKPDCIYERYNLFFISGIWAKKRFQLPLLLEVNAPLFEERNTHDSISLKSLADWSEQYAWRNADYVLPVTEVLARKITEKNVPKERIVVIPNGVNKGQFAKGLSGDGIRENYNLRNNLILGFTGFVREWHRLDKVLDVIAENRDFNWHMLLVGDGPARAMLEKKAADLNITEHLTITGIVQRGQIPEYIACFDIALQPDVVEYASPLKLFEYLALGKAVIAPNKDNIQEILSDRVNAVLFNTNSETDFSNKLKEVCTSTSLREQISKGALDLVNDRSLYWDSNAEKIIGLFEEIVVDRG
ncbi:MAG: glycosyltransferase family 4 protein [Sedimenticola sp.]